MFQDARGYLVFRESLWGLGYTKKHLHCSFHPSCKLPIYQSKQPLEEVVLPCASDPKGKEYKKITSFGDAAFFDS